MPPLRKEHNLTSFKDILLKGEDHVIGSLTSISLPDSTELFQATVLELDSIAREKSPTGAYHIPVITEFHYIVLAMYADKLLYTSPIGIHTFADKTHSERIDWMLGVLFRTDLIAKGMALSPVLVMQDKAQTLVDMMLATPAINEDGRLYVCPHCGASIEVDHYAKAMGAHASHAASPSPMYMLDHDFNKCMFAIALTYNTLGKQYRAEQASRLDSISPTLN